MTKLRIDIDLIFKSFKGRSLILLNKEGRIFKTNEDAYSLLGITGSKSLEGQKWDDTFAPLSKDDFSFGSLINTTTDFLYFGMKAKNNQLRVKVDLFELNDHHPGKYYMVTCMMLETGNWEKKLFQVMKGTEKDIGENYIQSVTKALAQTLEVDYAFIGKLKDGPRKKIRAISFWEKHIYRDPFEYDLKGSPCEDVVNKSQKFIPRNVTKAYPKDKGLVKLGVESYFGTPIYYSNGKPLGLLVVMDSKPMVENPSSAYILNIFASRIGVEMEWAETQKTLQKKDRKLKNVINAIPHPIFYKDREGRYEGVNQAFIDATELTEDEIIGKKSIRKENKNKAASYDLELLSKVQHITYESPQKLKDGGEKSYAMTKSSIVDEEGNIEGIAGAAMDITNQKIAEKELQVSEEKFRRLFSTANDAIFIMSNGIFIDCNEKTLEIFDCKRDEIIGKPPYEYSPKLQPNGSDSEESAMKKILAARNGEPQNFYWKHKKKSGAEFDAEVSLNAFEISNETFIQAIVRDVTDKMQLSRNVTIQNERMEEIYKYISASDISFHDQLKGLLKLATSSLGMEVGILSRINNNEYKIEDYFSTSVELDKEATYNLNDTYCDITFHKDRLLAIENMASSEYKNHPSYELFNMESYIGAPYWVRGERYGTLAFMSHEPVRKFRPIDYDFVQMLAQWVGSTVERSQYEQNLLERDALLETMLREIPIDFSVRDANLDMVIQSDLSKQYWGNNEGKPIDYKDVDEKSKVKWQNVFARALNGEVVKGEDNVVIYDKPYSFYSIASPVIINDKVTEVIVINIDISKIKETAAKLREQNEQLSKLNTELDRFVYSASHDLRAPLASLLGLIDLTGREINSESTKHYLELMSKSINTMDRFISDITEYSRNLRLDTNANLVDFNKLIKEAFDHIQFMHPGPATYEIKISGKVGFYTDYERLRMIFNNLISNSIRYKFYGRDPHIEFNIKLSKKKAEINIIDNGIGIAKEHLNKVFDMFYRANDKNVGSGLGLFIVKETVDKLKGEINITSKLNEGTQIHLELPNMGKPTS